MSPKPQPIDFARYAEVMAHLARFPTDKIHEVIARLGLRRRDWDAAATKWTAARDAELARGKTDFSDHFASIFTRTRTRLERARPSLESLGPLPAEEEVQALAPELPAPTLALPPPVIAMISAQLAPLPPAAPSFLVQQPREPGIGPSSPWGLDLPRSAIAHPAANPLQFTLPLGTELPLPRLPFTEAVSSPEQIFEAAVAHAQAAQGTPDSRREARNLGATVGVSHEVPSAALPFVPRLLLHNALQSTIATAAPLPPVSIAPKHFGATMPISAELPAPSLPFSGLPSSPGRAFEGAVAHAQAAQEPVEPRRNSQIFGSTAGMSNDAPSPALPFLARVPSAPGARDLTLPQYASLRVELYTYPTRTEATLARYGVPARAHAALDEQWRMRFQTDPMSRMEFVRAFAAYTAYLRENPDAGRG